MEWFAALLTSIVAFFAALFGAPQATVSYEYVPPISNVKKEAVVLFGGDMMFDRAIRIASEEHGGDHIFSCIKDTLRAADIVVANLEGPITEHASVSLGSTPGDANNFTFTFPTSTAELLARHNIGLVNLGNNHILNFGQSGERATRVALGGAGVQYFGDTQMQRIATTTIHGVTLAFINYNQFSDSSTASTTESQVRAVRAEGYIPIVFAHWGDEYVSANSFQKRLAHRFVDAGAELVIGTHPHVIQENELYLDKHVYYSLGNLIFDQYWEEAVRRGIMVRVTLDESGVQSVLEIPTELIRGGTTCLIESS